MENGLKPESVLSSEDAFTPMEGAISSVRGNGATQAHRGSETANERMTAAGELLSRLELENMFLDQGITKQYGESFSEKLKSCTARMNETAFLARHA